MSDSSQENSGTASDQWPAKDSGGGTRRLVLFGLLGLMVVALAYDYLVARPAVNAAYDKITDESVAVNRTGTGFLSNLKVRELVGKEPAETFMDGDQSVEVFHWAGGLIVKPHKLYAVYKKSGDDKLFYRHSKFAYEASSVVTPDRPLVQAPDEDDSDAEEALYEAEMTGGDQAGGGQAGGGQRGGGGDTDSSSRAPSSARPADSNEADSEKPSRPELETETETEKEPETEE